MLAQRRNRQFVLTATLTFLIASIAAIGPFQFKDQAAADEYPACAGVIWTRMVNTTAFASTLQKTGGLPYTWDAGAISTQSLTAGDASVAVLIDSTDTYRMFGF